MWPDDYWFGVWRDKMIEQVRAAIVNYPNPYGQ
jgi:hypothetical protein